MKPASRTVSYIVYPSDYTPGDGSKKAKSLKEAKAIAARYGVGAEIDRCIETKNKRRTIFQNMVDQFSYA